MTDLHVMCLRGGQLHLVTMESGVVIQAPGLDVLIEAAKKIPGLRLIVLDPLARLHGIDENSNALNTALINAAERLAEATGAAVLIVHHISKAASRDGEISTNASRGGKALTDGARSALQLSKVTAEPKGIHLRALRQDGVLSDVTMQEYKDGRVLVLTHVKHNLSAAQPDLYFLRASDRAAMTALRVESIGDDGYAQRFASLKRWWMLLPPEFVLTKEHLRESYKSLDAKMTRNEALVLLEDAVARGDIVEAPDYQAANNRARGYILATRPADPPRPAEDLAGQLGQSGGTAADRPAAVQRPMAAAGLSAVSEDGVFTPRPQDTRRDPPKRVSTKRRSRGAA
jgi:hypothetical protein